MSSPISVFVLCLLCLFGCVFCARGVEDIVAVFDSASITQTPTQGAPDGPLTGNGVLGSVLGFNLDPTTSSSTLTQYLGSNDFWDITNVTQNHNDNDNDNDNHEHTTESETPNVKTVGSVVFSFKSKATFSAYQFPANGTVQANLTFADGGVFSYSSYVSAITDASSNVNYIVTSFSYTASSSSSSSSLVFTLSTSVPANSALVSTAGFDDKTTDIAQAQRTAHLTSSHLPDESLIVSLSSRLFGSSGAYSIVSQDSDSSSFASFTVEIQSESSAVTLITATATGSSNQSPSPSERTALFLANVPSDDFNQTLLQPHLQWWNDFWSNVATIRSDDDNATLTLNYYYGALYLTAISIRPDGTAPGLYGPFVTTDSPNWHGDYTLNYNFESVWYGVYGANLPRYGLSYISAFEAYLPLARDAANRAGCPGVDFPVHIAPFGYAGSLGTGEQSFLGQHSAGLFLTLNVLDHVEYTKDVNVAKKVYEVVKGVVEFQLCRLLNETVGSSYQFVPQNDCANEDCNGGSQSSRNSILTNSFLRRVLPALISLSSLLSVDVDLRPVWNNTFNHLAALPTSVVTLNGVSTSIYAFADGDVNIASGQNPLNVYPLFPAQLVDLETQLGGSPNAEQTLASNTIAYMQSWQQDNAFNQIFPAATRSVLSPEIVFTQWNDVISKKLKPNLWLQQAGGGLETVGGVRSVVDMLVQASPVTGRISFFASWPRYVSVNFYNVRAPGAILVNGTLLGASGYIAGFYIHSEAGSHLSLNNPWPTNHVVVSKIFNDTRTPVPIVYHGLNLKEWLEFDTEAGIDYFFGASF